MRSDPRKRPLIYEELARFCLAAQPGCQVGNSANGPVFLAALKADQAKRRVPHRDPDAIAQVVPEPLPSFSQCVQAWSNGQRRLGRAPRRVIARERVIEVRHYAVA